MRTDAVSVNTHLPLPVCALEYGDANASDETMADLFEAGYKKEQVLDALRQLPLVGLDLIGNRTNTQHPAMKRAVTNLKNRGDTTFLCLSNSNEVYIGTILEVSSLTSGIPPPLPR